MTPNRDAAIRAEANGHVEFIEPALDAHTEWQYARSCDSCRDEVHECGGDECMCGCEASKIEPHDSSRPMVQGLAPDRFLKAPFARIRASEPMPTPNESEKS